jgi:hypothetical protein
MPRFKPYDYDQLLMVPVSLEEQLVSVYSFAVCHAVAILTSPAGCPRRRRARTALIAAINVLSQGDPLLVK